MNVAVYAAGLARVALDRRFAKLFHLIAVKEGRSMRLIGLAVAIALIILAGLGSSATVYCASLKTGPCSEHGGYRASRLGELTPVRDSTLIVVAFSGGGTRAAAFAYGVLLGLDSLRLPGSAVGESLLERVNVLSGVSGGAFTAAHFALFGRAGFREFEEKFLFVGHLPIRLVLGYAIVVQPRRSFGRHFSRSDYAADQWDRVLFHGKTFGDLERKRSGPFLIVHATNLHDMSPFPFLQERFDAICGDMSEMPVARAVGASSAFPGLLTPITIENFLRYTRYTGTAPDGWQPPGESCHYLQPEPGGDNGGFAWFETGGYEDSTRQPCGTDSPIAASMMADQEPGHLYVRLIDGGMADNLGVCMALRGMEHDNAMVPLKELIAGKVRRLVVVMVDAGTTSVSASERPKPPGLVEELGEVAGHGIGKATAAVREDFRYAAPLRVAKATGLSPNRVYFATLTLLECSGRLNDAVNFLPTTFGLPKSDVTTLIALGARCTKNNPTIGRFLRQFSQAHTTRGCNEPLEPGIVGCTASGVAVIRPPDFFDDPILFDFESLTVREDAIPTLNRAIEWLLSHPEMRVLVEGNSDERGSDEYNFYQGKRRAVAVKRYLVTHGIDPSRVDMVTYGDERPLCAQHNDWCWQLNRRVNLSIVPRLQ